MRKSALLVIVLAGALCGDSRIAGAPQHEQHHAAGKAKFAIPQSLKVEHERLQADLAAAIKKPGKTGEAARHVAELMDDHFRKEEEFALPPLGLLPSLAAGRLSPEMRDVIVMTGGFKANLPSMLEEHKAIVAALNRLEGAATADGHADVVTFVASLKHHAQHEEQVLYPAALLVGEYVKLKLQN